MHVESMAEINTAVGYHKCQFCNEVFVEKQMLEDHVDRCDPYNIAIDFLDSDMVKDGKEVKKSKVGNSKKGKCSRKFKAAKVEAEKSLKGGRKVEKELYQESEEIHQEGLLNSENDEMSLERHEHSLFHRMIDSATDVSSNDKNTLDKNVKEDQKTNLDRTPSDVDDPNFIVEEVFSSNIVERRRSSRKRKLKKFEDYETVYADSTNRKHLKSSCNDSDQDDNEITKDETAKLQGDRLIKSRAAKTVKAKGSETQAKCVTFFCPLCEVTEEVLEKMQDHIRNTHDQKRLSWVVLSSNYKQMQEVNKDPAFSVKEGKTKCSSCKKECHSTKQLMLHVNKHHAYYPYCCGICRLAFVTKEAVKLHMKKIHLKEYILNSTKHSKSEESKGQVSVNYYVGKIHENDSKANVKSKTELSKCIRQESSKDVIFEDPIPPTYDPECLEESNKDSGTVLTLETYEQKKQKENADVRKSKEKGNVIEKHSVMGKSKKRTHVYNKKSSAIKVQKVEEASLKENLRFPVNHIKESNISQSGNEHKKTHIKDSDRKGLQIYEHQDKDQKVNQGENAAIFVKFNVTAQENWMTEQHPVIKSIKVFPKKVTSKVNVTEMEVKDKETELVRVQSLEGTVQHGSKNDLIDTDTEVVEFDANLSDTDEGDFEDDKIPLQSEMKFKRKKKQHDTQQLFNFSRLKGVDFKCLFEKCGELLPSFEVWQNHQIKHTKKRKRAPFTCMECGYSTRDKRVLNQHLLIKHNSLETVEISIKCCEVLHRETTVPLKVIACVFCGFLNDLQNFTILHKCYRKRLNFYCPFCIKKDSVFESLQDHIRGEHFDKTLHRQEMGYRYQSLRKSQKDPASYMNDHDTECSDCGLVLETNEKLKMHVNEKHAIFPYSCGVCRQCYGRHTAVMDHMRKTHSLPMTCQHCGRGFGDKADLCRHEASHQITKPFKCDVCGSRYADQKGLRTHNRLKHTERDEDGSYVQNDGADLFICDICGLSFNIYSQFKKHSERHCGGETEDLLKVNCVICSKAYTRNAFRRHLCTKEIGGNGPAIIQGYSDTVESVKDLFLKIKQSPAPGSGAKVSCGLCHKDFNKNKYMYNHIRQVHLPNEGKKIHCSVCNAGFNRRPQLMAHMRSHSNVKPYKCRICSKYFRQLGHVKVHLLSHSKKPSFKCKLCSQVFKAKCSLANHVLTHCDIYPYTCFVLSCKRAFNSLQNLLVHVRQCAAHTMTNIDLECKICANKLDSLKNGLVHMKSHSKDRLYKCSECAQDFLSYRQLYNHKDRINHFSETELEKGACKSNSVQNFKCVEVDEDLETLQQLYDYLPEEIDSEKSCTDAKQDSDQGQHLDYRDAEEIEVENVIESDMLMDIAEQLTHMAEREAKQCPLPAVQIKTEAFDVNSIETALQTTEFDSEGSQAKEVNCNFSAKDGNIILNKIEIESQNNEQAGYEVVEIESNKQTDFGTGQREENNKSDFNFFAVENGNVHIQILGSQPVIDENAVVVATEAPVGRENTFIEETQGIQDTIQNASVEMQSEDQLATNVVSEEMLATSKIFDEFGKEVKVNLVNDKGHHVPIQSNPELLQTLLSTGKYSLHFAESESNIEEFKVMQNVEENVEAASENELFQKPNSAMEFENLDFNLTEGTDIYVINEMPSVEEYKYSIDIDDRFETQVKKKKVKTDNIQTERKVMNTDKVLGDIIDKEAVIGNHKMETGQINYKVRLHYYEDRTKQEEQYPLKCDLCSFRFRRVKDLNAHKKRHLPNDAKPFQCKECGKGYTTRHAFMAHMLIHTGERPHRCDQCQKSFRQLGHLQTHLRTHANYRPFKCRHCDKTFVTNSQLKQHAPSHGAYFQQTIENGIDCLVCGNVFSSEKELATHKLKHLSVSDQEDLLKEFNILLLDESPCTKDKKTKSGVQGSYMCDVCGKMFKHPSDLKDHAAVHTSDSKISCKLCGSEFISERRLQTHVNNIHSAERWQCDTCGLQLKSKFSFKSHMLHHKGPKFKCAQCNKEFTRKHRFLQHLPSCLGDSFMQKLQNLTDRSSETGTTEKYI